MPRGLTADTPKVPFTITVEKKVLDIIRSKVRPGDRSGLINRLLKLYIKQKLTSKTKTKTKKKVKKKTKTTTT